MGFNGGFYKRRRVLRDSFAYTTRICCATQTADVFRRLFTGVNVVGATFGTLIGGSLMLASAVSRGESAARDDAMRTLGDALRVCRKRESDDGARRTHEQKPMVAKAVRRRATMNGDAQDRTSPVAQSPT